ncbi:hypothetical protein [Paraburkholderia hospita]|uniref:hypothetical protein n=1 Tax=Paraburkholderia hospita TaxID=169430 RepID=UPI000271C73F|nr:hypothetical protein [Paraburkholderia hospita]EUC18680.1 hypothetical protein PMI06_003305 [Burkholderia sp. BT03]
MDFCNDENKDFQDVYGDRQVNRMGYGCHAARRSRRNVTAAEIREAQSIAPVFCVQNMFNVMHRQDDSLVDALAVQGVAFVPYFPLGSISHLRFSTLSDVAGSLGAISAIGHPIVSK